jgi:hypothetical protein
MYEDGVFDLVADPINRYLVGSLSEHLEYGEDGSLWSYVQHTEPSKDKISNWLPAPKDSFFLIARFYAPTQQVIDLDYCLPAAKNVIGWSLACQAQARHSKK